MPTKQAATPQAEIPATTPEPQAEQAALEQTNALPQAEIPAPPATMPELATQTPIGKYQPGQAVRHAQDTDISYIARQEVSQDGRVYYHLVYDGTQNGGIAREEDLTPVDGAEGETSGGGSSEGSEESEADEESDLATQTTQVLPPSGQ